MSNLLVRFGSGFLPLGFIVLLLFAKPITAQSHHVGHVFAANLSSGAVSQHDPATARHIGSFVAAGTGGLQGATGLAFGPDGRLYVSSSATHSILRFNGNDGSFIDTFVRDSILRQPFSLIFGPDNNLYVSSGADHHVLKYSSTGVLLDTAVADLTVPIGLRFGPDGALYVASAGADQIVRYDQETETKTVFIGSGLDFPSDLVFADDGRLFVTSAITRQVLEYDGQTGVLIREVHVMPTGSAPVGIDIALDGDLLVADFAKSRIVKINRVTGAVLEMIGDLNGPENIVVKRH